MAKIQNEFEMNDSVKRNYSLVTHMRKQDYISHGLMRNYQHKK